MGKEFTQWFLHPSDESKKMYHALMDNVITLIANQTKEMTQPFSGKTREEIESKVREILSIPVAAQEMDQVMNEIENSIVRNSLWISHPSAMAHLHCPPLLPSLAAEVIINALNQSMDSWDQSPAATYVETELIKFLTKQIGYSHDADGTFTTGGTQSNYMGVLLARNKACQMHFSAHVQKEGLPGEARKLRILCSEHAHFTVQKSAAQLGLGMDAVVKVAANDRHQFCVEDAKRKIRQLRKQGLLPFMVVATAGTTDFGSIDCLGDIAELANKEQLWLHVDAAYGGALLFSHQHGHLVRDLCLADSITIDFHKLYYQSISCGAFFVKHQQDFQQIAYHAEYLNPEEDLEEGIINLVEKSVQTTKRFDALKLLMTWKLIGTDLFGKMVDYTIHLAKETARLLKKESCFEVLNEPELNAVVFRFLPSHHRENQEYVDEINLAIQRTFYQSGELIMAKTKQGGKVYLKFTMLNPLNTIDNMKVQIEKIKQAGEKIEKEQGENRREYSVYC
ncbi:pyridoxal phosphate-dependent decarboxylase family protein [Niallia endozanthoxylica]|uniref:Aspartate aminotransferase family protein n=1 Tax=Niallia endozanthoxylica TaxID=2036016 RepID=A0A5J5I5I2_9BACI|nr:aspartate aminotransferase family protein [Niallia endozanthoxylica]KAA9030680.1 aspartate aminotransferase family protein [Niallia endozanthoxylica]